MTMEQLESLAAEVGAALAARRWMMATVESCTGGWVAASMTAIAGSSGWFERGFVTYSNEAKMALVGVRAETLERCGAVSEDTAAEMARGGVSNSRADIVVSITGVAGPGGGTATKPVGMVCFGWALRDGAVQTETKHFAGDRRSVREQSVEHALRGVLNRSREQ